MKPSRVIAEPLEGPHAKSISRLSTIEALPTRRKLQALDDVPPDVQPARVDQLELEVVHGAPPAQPEAHGELRGHGSIDRTAGDYETFAAFEIEVHPQRIARGRTHRAELELGVTGNGGYPFIEGHGSAMH